MLLTSITLAVALTAVSHEAGTQAGPAEGRDWPSFRGPGASGVSEGRPTPLHWDVESGQNVLWRVPVPGLANSSPVVWADKVFLTSAVSDGEPEFWIGRRRREYSDEPYAGIRSVPEEGEHQFQVICLNKQTGEILWARTAVQGAPRFKRHPKGTHANPTPATDGEHLVTFFGSEGLYCHDLDGRLLWKVDLGELEGGFYKVPEAQWGIGSSPVLHDGRVIVLCDVLGVSFLVTFDVRTGEELWRVPRDDVPTWGTPTIDERGGLTQIVVNGHRHTGGYDLETGEELWRLAGGGDIPIPTPIVACDKIIVTSSHGKWSPIWAIRRSAAGELEVARGGNESMAWSWPQRGSKISTPLVYGSELYLCSDLGVIACFDLATGALLYRQRLFGSEAFSSSPVASHGRIYLAGESGDVHVVRAAREFDLLATNALGEPCLSTPAISEGVMFWRTQHHLLAIGQEPGPR